MNSHFPFYQVWKYYPLLRKKKNAHTTDKSYERYNLCLKTF